MSLRDFGLLVLVCLIWATNNVMSKYVVGPMGVPPLFYASVRFALVTVLIFPWLFQPMPRPRWRLIVIALLMGVGNFAMLFVGLKTATPSSAAVVLQVGVPITTLLSVLVLGEKIGWRRGLGIALTFAGALAVMWDPHGFRITPGLVYVAMSALFSSIAAILMKQMEGVKPLQYQAWVGFASVWPLALLSFFIEPGQVAAGLAAGWPFVAAVVFSAVVVSIGSHSLYYVLVRRYEANLISPLTLMTPLGTIAGGVIFMHDPFDLQMAFGAAAALAGVLVIALRRNQVMPLFMALWSRSQ